MYPAYQLICYTCLILSLLSPSKYTKFAGSLTTPLLQVWCGSPVSLFHWLSNPKGSKNYRIRTYSSGCISGCEDHILLPYRQGIPARQSHMNPNLSENSQSREASSFTNFTNSLRFRSLRDSGFHIPKSRFSDRSGNTASNSWQAKQNNEKQSFLTPKKAKCRLRRLRRLRLDKGRI